MGDPVTIGGLAATALAITAETGFKEAVKDAYQGLKEKLVVWAGGEIAMLEAAPGSKGKQLAVAEIIDAQSSGEQSAIRVLAEALMDAIEAREQAHPTGFDVGRIHALRVRFGEIDVTQGTGVRVDEIVTPGEFSVDKLKVGKQLR